MASDNIKYNFNYNFFYNMVKKKNITKIISSMCVCSLSPSTLTMRIYTHSLTCVFTHASLFSIFLREYVCVRWSHVFSLLESTQRWWWNNLLAVLDAILKFQVLLHFWIDSNSKWIPKSIASHIHKLRTQRTCYHCLSNKMLQCTVKIETSLRFYFAYSI